ncbi:uncharacterized methyltransferase YdaC-like [Ptychodera flava]|uniref:uncharacterized methyltransferase YdaC-like n=1 Tax=Ptychodera flava TaxID=63121 RepID=UPI00396AAAD4
MEYLRNLLAQNLRKPTGFFGWVTAKFILARYNATVELQAVTLCDIQKDHYVLELGFGPGLGLQEAVKYLEPGKGKLVGVDFSSQMVRTTASKLESEIKSGLVDVLEGDVMSLPLEGDIFDRVYHCNCYYFWPDLLRGSKEIFRVMKSGGLMVTTMKHGRVVEAEKTGKIPEGSSDINRYTSALKMAGFVDVKEDRTIAADGEEILAILATCQKSKDE